MKKNELTKKEVLDPKKLEGLSKTQLIRMVQDSMMPFNEPEKYKEMVRASMPEFVREVDNVEMAGTAMYESGSEYHMVVMDCLRRYHGWKDSEIKQLHREITDVLTGVKEFEDNGLSMLSLNSVMIVGDNVQDLGIGGLLQKIAEVRLQKAKMEKAGFEVPKQVSERPFMKRVK